MDSVGVAAAFSSISFFLADSLSITFFFKKTLIVVRRALLGRQSSALTGSCKHTGHASGSEAWPIHYQPVFLGTKLESNDLQSSQIDWSQQGIRNALLASLLHAAQRSLTGISSIVSDLKQVISNQTSSSHEPQLTQRSQHLHPWLPFPRPRFVLQLVRDSCGRSRSITVLVEKRGG